MLKFTMDRKEIILTPINDKGNIGQVLIYGENVCWDENSNTLNHPLSNYSSPATFVIIKTKTGKNGYYILSDGYGKTFKLPHKSSDYQYLYDSQKWFIWNQMRQEHETHLKDNIIKKLKKDVEQLARYAY